MMPCLSKGLGRVVAFSRPAFPLPLSRSYSQTTIAPVSDKATSYFIPRNSRGSLPVYSDIRNGRTRYLVLVKNIRGDVHSLRDDLVSSLFEPESDKAARLKTEIARPDTLVVTGGRWKHDILDWLRRSGF